MDSLERCRILCGISEDNTKKLGLLSVLLEKAREDIEAFCRDGIKKMVNIISIQNRLR